MARYSSPRRETDGIVSGAFFGGARCLRQMSLGDLSSERNGAPQEGVGSTTKKNTHIQELSARRL